jgi:hypothetical protein
MTLGELLQYLRVAILNDRSDRVSGSSDYLWTDETLVTNINEAHRRFASKGLVLRDGTTDEATKITLVDGQAAYPVHECVLAVLSAKISTATADLTRVGHNFLAAYRAPTDQWTDPATVTGLPPGPTLAYSTDEGLVDYDSDSLSQIGLRVHPVPTAEQDGQVIRLRVIRKPIDQLVATSLSMIPEIPSDYHIDMLDWAAYLALRIVDDDAGAPKRAAEFKATFEENVKGARQEVLRKMFVPQGWGFGRGGYSWGQ